MYDAVLARAAISLSVGLQKPGGVRAGNQHQEERVKQREFRVRKNLTISS